MSWRFSTFYALILLTTAGAFAQAGPNIFVTPVPSAPFSAVIEVERSTIQPDGSVLTFKTVRNVGRDSKGRIFNESRELVPATSTRTPELLTVLIYDPETRISAVLDSNTKIYRVSAVNRPPATVPPGILYASPTGGSLPSSQFTNEDDLGVRQMGGLLAHGVRKVQTIPPESSGTGKPITITDEYWYSNDLRINVMLKHIDPRIGNVNLTVSNINQSEPDPARFQIPGDYTSVADAKPQARK